MRSFTLLFLTIGLSFNAYAGNLLDGVSMAINETPYSAIVTPISYETATSKEEHESVSVITAKVNTAIRGSLPEEIQFTVVSAIGDRLGLVGEPILVAFCRDNQALYFAGTGAAFSPTPKVSAHAQWVAEQLNNTQTSYAFCD